MRRLMPRMFLLVITLALTMTVSAFALNLQGGTVTTSSSVNLREGPGTDSDILSTLPDQARVAVLSQEGSWYQVAYNGVKGYLHGDYLSVQDIMNIECGGAKITASVLNLREKPTTDSGVIARLYKDEVAKIIGINNGWFKVQSDKGTGYVHPDYVTVTTYSGSSSSSASASAASTTSSSSGSLRWDIVNYAANFLGVKYTYGGSSPSTGFDCSGFVKYVYAHFGLSLSRCSSSQYSDCTRIKKSDLNIGDLVFFSSTSGGSSVGHVGIYVGGGQFIHAPSPGKTVCYESLSSSYYSSHYLGSGTVLY
ncbi:MAG: SH3 domain-containing protein [Clostridiaceae bacterium]|nr:SH3 domain-containing protein [Clostridiaceae bacterium]